MPLENYQRALVVDSALRAERDQLRAKGGAQDLRLADFIEKYVNESDQDSKARLHHSLFGSKDSG